MLVDLRFILFPVLLLVDVAGAVLVYRKAKKTGGILLVSANAIYLARCLWILFVLIDRGMGGEVMVKILVSIALPTLLSFIGGILAMRAAAGRVDAIRTGERPVPE